VLPAVPGGAGLSPSHGPTSPGHPSSRLLRPLGLPGSGTHTKYHLSLTNPHSEGDTAFFPAAETINCDCSQPPSLNEEQLKLALPPAAEPRHPLPERPPRTFCQTHLPFLRSDRQARSRPSQPASRPHIALKGPHSRPPQPLTAPHRP